MYNVIKSTAFDRWLRALNDQRAHAKILLRIRRIEQGNFGDHKAISANISEIRIVYGPGYRLYYHIHGAELVLLLIGGNKSTQQRDIDKAKAILFEYEAKK